MSKGKNTSRMSYTKDHTDELTTLNKGEATLTALQFHFLPWTFLEWELKLFLKSIADMSKGSFSISPRTPNFTEKVERRKREKKPFKIIKHILKV